LIISFRYYKDEDFLKLEELILVSYTWGNPPWGFSRHEFCRGVHSAWGNVKDNWRHTVGIYDSCWKSNTRLFPFQFSYVFL
jgi:hypothetical protein